MAITILRSLLESWCSFQYINVIADWSNNLVPVIRLRYLYSIDISDVFWFTEFTYVNCQSHYSQTMKNSISPASSKKIQFLKLLVYSYLHTTSIPLGCGTPWPDSSVHPAILHQPSSAVQERPSLFTHIRLQSPGKPFYKLSFTWFGTQLNDFWAYNRI